MTAAATEERTFTEKEKDALVADAVARETASLTERVSGLERDLAEARAAADNTQTELQTKLDTIEAEKAAAVAERDQLRGEFDTFKTDTQAKAEAAARRDARVAEVREVATALTDTYFTAERADRWAAMNNDDFAAHKAELAAVAGAITPGPAAGGTPPRETAMTGTTPPNPRGDDPKPSATKQWLLGTTEASDPAK